MFPYYLDCVYDRRTAATSAEGSGFDFSFRLSPGMLAAVWIAGGIQSNTASAFTSLAGYPEFHAPTCHSAL